MSLKQKYPFINQLHYNDILADLINEADGIKNGTADINANVINGNEIVENMNGYSFTKTTSTAKTTLEYIYAGAVKNGNKLTLSIALNVTRTGESESISIGDFTLPQNVVDKLYPTQIGAYNYLTFVKTAAIESNYGAVDVSVYSSKLVNGVRFSLTSTYPFTTNNKTYLRIETTFLLSDNLVSN